MKEKSMLQRISAFVGPPTCKGIIYNISHWVACFSFHVTSCINENTIPRNQVVYFQFSDVEREQNKI